MSLKILNSDLKRSDILDRVAVNEFRNIVKGHLISYHGKLISPQNASEIANLILESIGFFPENDSLKWSPTIT
jgi:GGDEF domain-containing protein